MALKGVCSGGAALLVASDFIALEQSIILCLWCRHATIMLWCVIWSMMYSGYDQIKMLTNPNKYQHTRYEQWHVVLPRPLKSKL